MTTLLDYIDLLSGVDLEILGRGFLTTASDLLISQLSLMMVALGFYHPLISKSFMEKFFEMEGVSGNPLKPPLFMSQL